MILAAGVLLLWALGCALAWCLVAVNPPEEPHLDRDLQNLLNRLADRRSLEKLLGV
jgi:hypothetical protein